MSRILIYKVRNESGIDKHPGKASTKEMVRTILFFTAFWVMMLLSMLFLLPIPFLYLFATVKRRVYVLAITRAWARILVYSCGINIEVQGLEHLPEADNLCFVSNHQSYLDIPVIMASVPKIIGFVAKKELRYVPFLSSWMKQIGCIFLDRKNPKQALRLFDLGAEDIRSGHAKLIFPEGTRNKASGMGPVRAGAMKLPFRAEALIVPITIDGTRRLLEAEGKVRSGKVHLTIHPPIPSKGLAREEQKRLTEEIVGQIASALPR